MPLKCCEGGPSRLLRGDVSAVSGVRHADLQCPPVSRVSERLLRTD